MGERENNAGGFFNARGDFLIPVKIRRGRTFEGGREITVTPAARGRGLCCSGLIPQAHWLVGIPLADTARLIVGLSKT